MIWLRCPKCKKWISKVWYEVVKESPGSSVQCLKCGVDSSLWYWMCHTLESARDFPAVADELQRMVEEDV